MAGDVTNIAKAPQGGAGGNTLSSFSASEGGLGLLSVEEGSGQEASATGTRRTFCHQEAALRNEAASPWEAQRALATRHWALATRHCLPWGRQKEAAACELRGSISALDLHWESEEGTHSLHSLTRGRWKRSRAGC